MNSLRSRLIVGSALIAVVPLVAVILVLSQRVESMVREDASQRLDAALGGLRARLAADAGTMAARIELLAQDPQLRRLHLVLPTSGLELTEYLAERRFLLGLDLLQVSDSAVAPPRLAIERVAGDTALAIVARAPIHYQGQVAGVVEGGVIVGAASLIELRDAGGVELALEDPAGRAIVATRADLAAASWLRRAVTLEIGAPPYPAFAGYASTAAADGAVRALRWSAALLGLLGLALAIVLGLVWSSQVSRPVERLAAFSDRLAQGHWDEPLALRSVRELDTLVAALDRMRRDLRSYRERLVTSERHAAWSQMARQVAHEVRNPLTPIAVSVADLKRSYELGRPDFPQILDQAVRTIGDEVESLRRLLQEFSDFGRLPPPSPAPMKAGDLLADLAALYPREVAEGRLALARPEPEVALSADAGQLRQALVNLVKNGFEAADGDGRVTVAVRGERDALAITVADTGHGLTAEQRAQLFTPGFTTKSQGSGLGLTIVEKIVNDHRGTIAVEPGAAGGTVVTVRLPLTQRPLTE